MELEASAVQTQSFAQNIDNVLPLKILKNPLYNLVFCLPAKPNVIVCQFPNFFGNVLSLTSVLYHNEIRR